MIKKRRRSKSSHSSKMEIDNSIPVRNRFDILDNNNVASTSKDVKKSIEVSKKVYKPSPIIITDVSKKLMAVDKLKDFNFSEYSIKNMSVGFKILLNSDSDFQSFSNYLLDQNIEFYSHSTKNEKIFKVILYGLPKVDISVIKNDLQDHNVIPISIDELQSKFSNENNAVYLLKFQANCVTLSFLKKIKCICHTIVKWKPYSNKFKGPTLCRNCSMFGHGASNCHRRYVCSLCASNDHNMDNCHFNKVPNKENIAFKCFNCFNKKLPANHRANDINCPCRSNYLEIRNKNKHNIIQNHRISTNSFQLDNNNFPVINSSAGNQNNTSINLNQNNLTYANQVKAKNDLFSLDELLSIFYTAVDQLKQCKSKLDQIQVISSLIKHAIH